MEETVTISKKEYESLREDSDKLSALECIGIDNWCGWGEAMDLLEERNNRNKQVGDV